MSGVLKIYPIDFAFPLNSFLFLRKYSMAGDSVKLMEEYRQKNKTAFVVGYTGATGKELVKALLESHIFAKVVLIGRRTVTYEDELYKDVEQRVVDFDNLDAHADAFKNFDVGYCCLGTTRGRSGAAGFYRVDHDYVVNSARLAKDGGCSQFHLLSSTGANKDSSFLFAKTKGEAEEDLKAMDFDSLFIYRPAMLLGDREERRPFEIAAKVLMKPITWAFPTAISIPMSMVAKALVNKTVMPATDKVELLDNKAVHRAAAMQ